MRVEQRIIELLEQTFDIPVVEEIIDLMDKYYEENNRDKYYAFLDGIETILEKIKEVRNDNS